MRKTELRDKSNFLHDTILKNPLGEKTSQESFQKVFKPITTKLDDVALSNLKLPILQTNVVQKWQFSIMGYAIEDEHIPDYGLHDLFDAEIQPEQNKQLVPKHYQHSL